MSFKLYLEFKKKIKNIGHLVVLSEGRWLIDHLISCLFTFLIKIKLGAMCDPTFNVKRIFGLF